MTRAPANLLAVRRLLLDHLNIDEDTSRSADLEPAEVGIVNRRCVNPDHLEPVSRQENIRRIGKTRSLYCLRGHRKSENRYASGRPGCRTCTREDNRARRVPAAPRGPVTHCKNGHEFTPENTYFQVKAGGRKSRQCRKCKVINQRRYEARKNGDTHDDSARQSDGGTRAAA